MVDVIEELPKEIVLYGIRYELAGYSIVSRNHITAVIMWRGEIYFYDGLGVTDQVRLKPLDKKKFDAQRTDWILSFVHNELSAECYIFVCLEFTISFPLLLINFVSFSMKQ